MMFDIVFEWAAVAVSLVSLALEYRASRWFWVFSIAASLMYAYFNFSHGIYANGAVQAYYFAASVAGLVYWVRTRDRDAAGSEERNLASMPARLWPWVLAASAALTVALALVLRALGESQVAWLDGLSTALGVVAMVLTAKKYYQSWLLWMAVEPLMIAMYLLNGNIPSAFMFGVYLLFAILGFFRWRRLALAREDEGSAQPSPNHTTHP